jgi:hypothetical protein
MKMVIHKQRRLGNYQIMTWCGKSTKEIGNDLVVENWINTNCEKCRTTFILLYEQRLKLEHGIHSAIDLFIEDMHENKILSTETMASKEFQEFKNNFMDTIINKVIE